MRKRLLAIICTLVLALSACAPAEGGQDTPVNSGNETVQENQGGESDQDASGTQDDVQSGSADDADKADSVTGDKEDTIGTTEVETPVSGDVWVPREAPIVRNEISEEEQRTEELAILGKGTSLFSGKVNAGYYPSDISWLKGAEAGSALAIIYACDDLKHGGWGVLGLSVGSGYKDIIAVADQPDKERLLIYSIDDIVALSGAANASSISKFSLGAWNGGRIAGLYYLPKSVADELYEYEAKVEETEQIIHTYTGELSNVNATKVAQDLYDYLQETYGTACITGQMESTWMGSPDYEMNYIEDNTGKLPAIRGLDFMHNDFDGVVERSKAWWEQGGIVTICWHTGAGFDSAYTESLNDNINWDEAFVPGSATYNALVAGMDRAVPALQELEDAGVPVLWRPFHELDGGWFWWSKGGSDNFVKLWQMMYSRYTDFWGLDNLIWVYGYSSSGADMGAWYPGDSYVDLIGADSYKDGPNGGLFEECDKINPEGMPIVFHECGKIPTEKEMKSADAPWLFFMVWHTDYITDTSKGNTVKLISEVYNSDYFITLDELPDFK